MSGDDQALAAEFTVKRASARAHLLSQMLRLGLLESHGWRIHEFTRQVAGRTELVMQPVHRTRPTPEGLECIVCIDAPAMEIKASCTDPANPQEPLHI